mmetsp:Transcript_43941/g.98866  ORF Transcript_43941/g.98866 Transcript_43941/m.98866 type:complete len:220 (-) Transcript_43941:11-670(-)
MRGKGFCSAICSRPMLSPGSVPQIRSPKNLKLLQCEMLQYRQQLSALSRQVGWGCTPVFPPGSRHNVPNPECPKGGCINEVFLLHGTTAEGLAGILQSGFDNTRSGQRNGRFFGSGLYFADEACKCDSYTQAENGQRTIVLARVCLGKAWLALSPKPDMKDPPRGFCSVVGESNDNGGVLDFREYVIYQGTQALPVYLIHYKHTTRCSCTRCKFSSPRG